MPRITGYVKDAMWIDLRASMRPGRNAPDNPKAGK